jgi:hypothetical protein
MAGLNSIQKMAIRDWPNSMTSSRRTRATITRIWTDNAPANDRFGGVVIVIENL